MDNNVEYNDSIFEMEDTELSLREYYGILVKACNSLEEDPDNDFAVAAFTDAAWHLAKADCGHLFPEDVLSVNAARTPDEGETLTAVKEDEYNVVQ